MFGCRLQVLHQKKNQKEGENVYITCEALSTEQIIFQNYSKTLKYIFLLFIFQIKTTHESRLDESDPLP